MAIRTHTSIITLNTIGINDPIKNIKWLNEYKNKTHFYSAYQRLTYNPKTHTQ